MNRKPQNLLSNAKFTAQFSAYLQLKLFGYAMQKRVWRVICISHAKKSKTHGLYEARPTPLVRAVRIYFHTATKKNN